MNSEVKIAVKILIAGDGKVGSTLTRQLSAEGYDLTLIDSNQKVLESSTEQYDVIAVRGNCASMETLRQANVEGSDLLIAATSADEVNLLCCMTAHGINPNIHTIARIRNPEYAEQAYVMRDTFALSLAVNPEKQAADEIVRLLQYPGFLKRDTFARGRVEIVELRIDAGSRLCDVPLSNLNAITRCQVLVCVVLRDGVAIMPDGRFVLREGDRFFVTASAENLALLLKNLGIITHKVKKVMLIGGSRIAHYLAQDLEKDGVAVTLIERDPERCVELAALLPSACIVQGDASSQAFLEREGIADCDALVTLTGLDELNMVIALYGSSYEVPQIITKLSRAEHTRILDSLPIGSVICPKELCCNTIVRYVRAMHNQAGAAVAIHTIADGQAEAIEFLVDETTLHCGEPLKRIKLCKNVLVACITRGGNTFEIPHGESHFELGDRVIIVAGGDMVIRQLNDIFEV